MTLTEEQQRRVDEALRWSRLAPDWVRTTPVLDIVGQGQRHAQKLITIIRELAEEAPLRYEAQHFAGPRLARFTHEEDAKLFVAGQERDAYEIRDRGEG